MPIDGELRARALRRAMLQPDRFLAAALAKWPDENLAELTGARAANCWKLRVMGWPREDHWVQDVEAMAAAIAASPKLLGRLLVTVDVRGVQP